MPLPKDKKKNRNTRIIYLINKCLMTLLYIYSFFIWIFAFTVLYIYLVTGTEIETTSFWNHFDKLYYLGFGIFFVSGLISNWITVPLKVRYGRPIWGYLSILTWSYGLISLLASRLLVQPILNILIK